MTSRGRKTVLLTGASGFLGKVVLFEMMRRREELDIDSVIVVVRDRGARTAQLRFRHEVATSPCFATLPHDWTRHVRVLEGDLAEPHFGTSAHEEDQLAGVTHIIHSAAAVSFTLPAPVAARANITTSLNLLAAARSCTRLERFVYVSTAYVTPHREGKVPERLVELGCPAEELLAGIDAGLSDSELLARTGHPNTYTLTKTIAEHLLAARCPSPLSIVRPSIITASRELPAPGWIDSTTGFGAFVTLIGLGHLRVVVGNPDARLDLVAVDDVARRVLDEALSDAQGVTVRHIVSGADHAAKVGDCWDTIDRYFQLNPVDRRPALRYLGPRNSAFVAADLAYHRIPIVLATLGSATRRRQARKLASRLDYLNEVFPYFTSRTFDFETAAPTVDSGFDAIAYVSHVCRGVSRHLLSQRSDEWVLAGRSHVRESSDLRWVARQPSGNTFVRFAAWQAIKTLRRISDSVTVDVPSFEAARDSVPDGASLALVPSHRSFLDFVLCSYLAFARPDLGIRVPFVAAAIEFGRLPLLGMLLRSVQTFYVERGAVRHNRNLDKRVHAMLDAGETIEFFLEGARSRSREFLQPKRGLLRCLQTSGRQCILLPVSISYDRVPEEAVFVRELAGAPKAGLRLAPLFTWLGRAWRGKVRLGRIHIACGNPVVINSESDVRVVADSIIRELRGAMAVTSFHIDAWCARGGTGADPAAIRASIHAAGGRILDSRLEVPRDLDPLIARTMREHFASYLDGDAATQSSEATAAVPLWIEDGRSPSENDAWHPPAQSTLLP
ncbi:MAG: SDR family oxidoreductase [Gemmatimonadota bacterium]